MSELNNSVTAVGNYNSVPTTITSNVSVVNLVDGLSITKEADKTNWVDGNLTYTIMVKNDAESSYEKPVVTDIIDTTSVDFVDGSVTIDGTPATNGSQYSYDSGTHTLTINLNDILPSSSSTLKFQIKKKN